LQELRVNVVIGGVGVVIVVRGAGRFRIRITNKFRNERVVVLVEIRVDVGFV